MHFVEHTDVEARSDEQDNHCQNDLPERHQRLIGAPRESRGKDINCGMSAVELGDWEKGKNGEGNASFKQLKIASDRTNTRADQPLAKSAKATSVAQRVEGATKNTYKGEYDQRGEHKPSEHRHDTGQL